MECFSYKGGCGVHVSRHMKEWLAWAIDKLLWYISIEMLLKTVTVWHQNFCKECDFSVKVNFHKNKFHNSISVHKNIIIAM